MVTMAQIDQMRAQIRMRDSWQVWIRRDDNTWGLVMAFADQAAAVACHGRIQAQGFRAAVRFLPGVL